ncbi:MAG TPA: ABC transporter permease [Acidobacteriaceae bacterium]|jgi:predicted permease|nr:ABC transporter permease [Acidobacteriaceae bacterium]
MLNALGSDLFFALRQLRRSPGFAITAMATLALGIGVTTALYSLIDGVLLRPFPLPHPEQLMAIHTLVQEPGGQPSEVNTSWPDFLDWQAQNHTFTAIAAVLSDSRLISRHDGSEGAVLPIHRVSPSYFRVLGVEPFLGRNFEPADEAAGHHVAVISYGFWQRVLGGDPHAVGQVILISSEPYTVIGIMPRGFVEPSGETVEVWPNIALYLEGSDPVAKMRGRSLAEVVGRLKPGENEQQATADLSAIQAGLAQSYREIRSWKAVSVGSKLEDVTASMRPTLLLLMAAVLSVLLIVCSNVAGLILTRAMSRTGEVALRTALGVSAWRVWRQLLTESLLLAAGGGLLGVVLGWALLRLALPWIPEEMPRLDEVGLNFRVLLFTAGISLLCAVFSSLWPAWKLMQVSPMDALREQGHKATSGRRSRRMQNTLVVVQATLGITLLIGSGFLIRGFVNVRNTRTGFEPDHLLNFMLPLTETRYPDQTRPAFYHALITRLAAIPGVESVSGGYPLPLQGAYHEADVEIDGRPNPPDHALSTLVGVAEPGFFETLGVPLVRGRLFTVSDDNRDAPRVVLVNQAFVKKFFPDVDPLGRHIRPDVRELRNQAGSIDPMGDADREIVGVVADMEEDSRINPPEPFVAFPYAQATALMRPTLIVRTAGDPMQQVKAASAAVQSMDPALFLISPRSMEEQLGRASGTQRFETWLIAGFSTIAMFLTGLSLYSMLASMVATRRREIGLRMAIGAARADVVWMVVARAVTLLFAGVIGGSLLAAAILRVVGSQWWSHEMLFGVSWTDPRLIAPMVAVLGAVAVAGCLLPAWQATRIEPAHALRDE